MKHSEDFKYQDRLEGFDQMPGRRVSKGGSLMIVFFVGVIMAAAIPVGFKLLTNSMLMTMAAHKTGQKIRATESVAVSSMPIDKTFAERPKAKKEMKAKVEKEKEKADRVEKATPKDKGTAAGKKEAKPVEKVLAKAKAKDVPKAVKLTSVEPRVEKTEVVKTESKASPKTLAVESVMEIPLGPNAAALQQQAEEELLSGAAVPLDVDYRTIYNASYSKDGLGACKQRCVLRIQDAKGQVQSAIINGPEFASILAGHNGTINVTGKKRLLKNHNVFVVQNITFNLTSGPGKQADVPTPAKPRYPGQQAKVAPEANEGYEDLSQNLSR